MKYLASVFLIFSISTAYGQVWQGNTMSAEQAPVNKSVSDTITSGQSSTERAPASEPQFSPNASTCTDQTGMMYYKNDSGYAACVNAIGSRPGK